MSKKVNNQEISGRAAIWWIYLFALAFAITHFATTIEAFASSFKLESKIIEKLNRVLSPKHYVLIVDVKNRESRPGEGISLIPGRQITSSGSGGAINWREIENVKVTILLSDHYGEESRSPIRSIVESQLSKLERNQIQINFDRLEIKAPPVTPEVQARIEASEQQLADYRRQSAELRRERQDLNTKLKDFVDRMEKLPDIIEKNTKENNLLPQSVNEKPENFPTAMLILIGAIALSLALIGLFSFLGLGRLGSSLEAGLKSVTKTPSSGSTEPVHVERNVQLDMDRPQPELAPKVSQHKENSFHELEIYLTRLKKQLIEEIEEDNLDVLISFVIENASKDSTVEISALVLEVLGEKTVRQIVSQIPKKQKRRIRNYFDYQDRSGEEKLKLMGEASEKALAAFASAKVADEEKDQNDSLALRAVSYEMNDYANMIANFSEEALPRLLGYLKPEIVGNLISFLSNKDPERAKQILESSANIPFYLEKSELDDEIAGVFDNYDLEQKEVSQIREHRSFYLKLLESSTDEAKTAMIDSLRKLDADFAMELDALIITFETFWRLPSSIQSTFLDKLSIQMIAVLIVDCKDENRKLVLRNSLSGPQQQLLDDELARLGDQLKWQELELLRSAKTFIISEIQKISEIHDLSTIMQVGNEDSLDQMKYKMTG